MATVTQAAISSNFTIYDVEPSAWASPEVWTFDDRMKMSLDNDNIIDIVIMAEGYTSGDQEDFENYVSDWYERFSICWPYSKFLSAFRVRAVFAASAARAGGSGSTYYSLGVETYNNCVNCVTRHANKNTDFVRAVFDTMKVVDNTVGLNKRLYPDNLLIGLSGDIPDEPATKPSARENNVFKNLARNLVGVLTIKRNTPDLGARWRGDVAWGGYSTTITAPIGHSMEGMRLNLALGQYDLHEFGHAFGLLIDEYIEYRKGYERDAEDLFDIIHQDPSNPSVFDLFNVTYTGAGKAVPWRHLASNGFTKRNGTSYVGQMWKGGLAELGVWHSEYKCLQNGTHHNYHHRTDEHRRYADLRMYFNAEFPASSMDRYCLWCEEIITIKILEKTDAFYREGDPLDDASIAELGSIWYRRWEEEMRPAYWTQFGMDKRILDRERWYHDPANLRNWDWDGDLRNTDLMIEITEKPRYRNLPGILLMWEL
jgi:hypothetical protein